MAFYGLDQKHLEGFLLAFDPDRFQGFRFHMVPDLLESRVTDEDPTDRAGCFQPLRRVHRVSDGRVLLAPGRSDVACNDGAGVDADSNAPGFKSLGLPARGQLLRFLLHFKAGLDRPKGVPLQRPRCAELHHERVADILVEHSPVGVNDRNHRLEVLV